MAARSGCVFPTSGGMVASKIQDVVAPFAQAAGEAMRCGPRREKSFEAECDRNRPLVAVGRSCYLRICSVMCMRGISERIVDHDKDAPEPHGSTLAKKLLAQWSGPVNTSNGDGCTSAFLAFSNTTTEPQFVRPTKHRTGGQAPGVDSSVYSARRTLVFSTRRVTLCYCQFRCYEANATPFPDTHLVDLSWHRLYVSFRDL